MNHLKKKLLKNLASVSKWAAVKAAGNASCASMHQPKEPAALKNLKK
ncbi:MAG: cyclic lactone autoinducer peptide [Oscillospiraceae bacterium]|nr:cyclic lactone autoinducer peptide [Oscillospiraceae bacterium]